MIIVITLPGFTAGETGIANRLFERGLRVLHLRKPGASREEMARWIEGIRPRYRERIVVHDHFDLCGEYGLRGIHARHEAAMKHGGPCDYRLVSVACHSMAEIEEVEKLETAPEYVMLSPVFDSISKPGYAAAFDREELRAFLRRPRRIPVVALGGVTASNTEECRRMGFDGVALLGHVWENPRMAVERFERVFPDTVLSIAGFDPSGGAGVTADLKTMERHGVYGLGVTTAVTFQNQREYLGTRWVETGDIPRQCDALFQEFHPAYVKIGLIRDLETLETVIDHVHEALPRARVIWDPILKASAGTLFHEGVDAEQLLHLLRKVYLVTPNLEEARTLFGEGVKRGFPDRETRETGLKDWIPEDVARETGVNILLKGGHAGGPLATDLLVTPRGSIRFSLPRQAGDKHGTGCTLSSAIAANLTLGYPLVEACRRGQKHVAELIRSNGTRLGTPRDAGDEHDKAWLKSVSMQFITDGKDGAEVARQAEAVCRGGCRWVQLRMKEASREETLAAGREVKEICRRHGALFIVNDRVDVAVELDADGVHLGLEDMNPREARELLGREKIVGGTCNTFEDIVTRYCQGVDYVGLGPYAFTTTKKRLSPTLGLEGYREITARCRAEGIDLPVHAIGGIRENDLGPLIGVSGVTGVALSSLITRQDDMEAETRKILNILKDKNE